MFVSIRRNFLTHLGLPGSSGLPEKLEKHVILKNCLQTWFQIMSVGSSTHFDISSRAIWGTKMFVSMSRNFWTYLGLPGSSGLPEKLEKHVILKNCLQTWFQIMSVGSSTHFDILSRKKFDFFLPRTRFGIFWIDSNKSRICLKCQSAQNCLQTWSEIMSVGSSSKLHVF